MALTANETRHALQQANAQLNLAQEHLERGRMDSARTAAKKAYRLLEPILHDIEDALKAVSALRQAVAEAYEAPTEPREEC